MDNLDIAQYDDEQAPCRPPDNDYTDGRKERIGNNRKKIPRTVAKAKAKAARIARRLNRK